MQGKLAKRLSNSFYIATQILFKCTSRFVQVSYGMWYFLLNKRGYYICITSTMYASRKMYLSGEFEQLGTIGFWRTLLHTIITTTPEISVLKHPSQLHLTSHTQKSQTFICYYHGRFYSISLPMCIHPHTNPGILHLTKILLARWVNLVQAHKIQSPISISDRRNVW